MKIRTITIFSRIYNPQDLVPLIIKARQAESFFQRKGYEVQTIRVTINTQDDESKIKELEKISEEQKLELLSIGKIPSFSPLAKQIPKILAENKVINCSVDLLEEGEYIKYAAEIILEITKINPYANFQFAGTANIPPYTPFYPAAYFAGSETYFSIGTQTIQEAITAVKDVSSAEDARMRLLTIYNEIFKKVEEYALQLEKEGRIQYRGIDTSTAPLGEESIAYLIENISKVKFGEKGTLDACRLITEVLKSIDVKKVGYCGLMLPPLEDSGLGKRNNEGLYTIDNLLEYSAVCGTGLDTVPIPGDVTVAQLTDILQKVVDLSKKLHKPLSARFFPIPGKSAGEMTEFDSPYLFNTKVMEI